jgi:poly(hydroxyalkanoate) granule-associated protein
MATASPKKPTSTAKAQASEKPNAMASKDIWLAGLGAMAQAQAQARAQGGKAFENLVADGLAFQRKSQAAAQEKINEAAAHFNQLAQGLGGSLGAGLIPAVGAKVDRLEHLFEDRVARALKSLGLPTSQEVANLQARVAQLEAALAQSRQVKTTASKAAAPLRKTSAKVGAKTSAKSSAKA